MYKRIYKMSQEKVIIDVREPDEFKKRRIDHSINVPLSTIDKCGCSFLKAIKGKVMIMCASGNRASLAKDKLKMCRDEGHIEVYKGGISKWIEEGRDVIHQKTGVNIPIMGQVQIVVGLMVTIGIIGGVLISSYFFTIPILMGTGLIFAGITGFCGLAFLLKKMPWNKG